MTICQFHPCYSVATTKELWSLWLLKAVTMATSELVPRSLQVTRITSVRPSDRVRHVDQLEETEFEQFYRAVTATDGRVSVDETSLEAGEVVVFTDCYSIELD